MNPVRPSRVSQVFANPGSYASRADSHGPAGHHTGTDFGSFWPIPIAGRKVRAILPGQVVISDYNSTMGNWVGVYNADHNLLVTYWHMAERRVKVGDWIQVYHVVGKVGSTGNSTAAHMHVQVNFGSTFVYSGHVNPEVALRIYSRKDARKLYKNHPKHPNAR